MLLYSEFFIEYLVLVTNTNLLQILILRFFIIDKDIPTCWCRHISQYINKGSFSSTISTQKSEYLSLIYCEIDFIKSVKLALFNFISFD